MNVKIMDKDQNNIFRAFEKTIIGPEISKVSGQLSEVVLDSILKEGLLKDVPIIGTAVSLYKVGQNLRVRHFIKKLYKILFQLNDLSEEERSNFIKKLDEEKRTDLLERLLYLIDRLDETQKGEIIGRLLRNYIKGALNREEFLRLSVIIDKTYLNDLKYFEMFYGYPDKSSVQDRVQFLSENDEGYIKEALVVAGLMIKETVEDEQERKINIMLFGEEQEKKTHLKTNFETTSIGMRLLEYGFSQ